MHLEAPLEKLTKKYHRGALLNIPKWSLIKLPRPASQSLVPKFQGHLSICKKQGSRLLEVLRSTMELPFGLYVGMDVQSAAEWSFAKLRAARYQLILRF